MVPGGTAPTTKPLSGAAASGGQSSSLKHLLRQRKLLTTRDRSSLVCPPLCPTMPKAVPLLWIVGYRSVSTMTRDCPHAEK